MLHFKRPAATSRGALTTRTTYIVEARSPLGVGFGECCTMPGLLPEPTEDELTTACREVEKSGLKDGTAPYSSPVRFGIECAVLNAVSGGGPIWDTPFTRGERSIPIHHLIWMDDADTMLHNMEEGIRRGFNCLKLKVGALPWAQEVELLHNAHTAFPQAEIRVDANGAFSPAEAPAKLEALAAAGVHLIEQPLAPLHLKELTALCRETPLPIALDESLIQYALHPEQRAELLDIIRPQAIVIKPSLHGGLLAAEHWAHAAEQRGIAWWINSALESNIGRTTLAEWCDYRAPGKLQGLGTGSLFEDDTPGRLRLRGNGLFYSRNA